MGGRIPSDAVVDPPWIRSIAVDSFARRPFRLLVVGYEPFAGGLGFSPARLMRGPPVHDGLHDQLSDDANITLEKTSVLSGRRRHGEPGNDLKNRSACRALPRVTEEKNVMRTQAAAGLILCGFALAGCASNSQWGSYHEAMTTEIPWQLTPASTASEAQGERTTVRYMRKFGRVRGTRIALANISKPMVPYPGPHEVVRPCRDVIQPQATRIGAYSVEAAAAGPQRLLAHNVRRQQVFFRIFYRNKAGIEVRQAALMCTLNASGTVVAAKPT
jgi:hypothetical protein